MLMKRVVGFGLPLLGIILLSVAIRPEINASQADDIAIDQDDLAGVVTSAQGPEAGVWVIAETYDLPTGFRKIVVTDERGRYLVPDLPTATYDVWVRGYGLVDSPKVQTERGQILNLRAVVAPDARAAAEYYPANYWFSLLEMPPASEFPGTGRSGNGIPTLMKTQAQYVGHVKSACNSCHQMGTKATREFPESLGRFPNSLAAWDRRVKSGQQGGGMSSAFARLGPHRKAFSDWTDRIERGEVPVAPPRPQGVERAVVISQWDWAHDQAFIHDLVSTVKRNPTLNSYGPVYSVDRHHNPDINRLDPLKHTAERAITVPIRDLSTPFSTAQTMPASSPYWDEELVWSNRANVHNPMLDDRNRLWSTATVRPPQNPDFCREGSTHPSAQHFPLDQSRRHLAMYDPDTQKVEVFGTCFNTHHLFFAEDSNDTLWFSTLSDVLGWFDTKTWDATGDIAKSQGWMPFVLDLNGNGKLDEYVEPGDPVDPTKDQRIRGVGTGGMANYGVMPSPVDDAIWLSAAATPGMIIRIDPGSNPPFTSLAEVYEPPLPGHTTRGIDVDRSGVVWAALNSGHFASFDRRKCKVLNGPTATGKHCPEGWTLYQTPGPNFKGVNDSGSADFHYFNFVDQFDTFGLGPDTPIANGTLSDALLALRPDDGTFVVLRVPYPMGFYTRGMDGRIDDPSAGWKGKGLWATYSSMAPWHYEGGKGQASKAVHFQLRPGPLAK